MQALRGTQALRAVDAGGVAGLRPDRELVQPPCKALVLVCLACWARHRDRMPHRVDDI